MNEITFEKALQELESIIKDLESGSIPLEEAINKYTDAMNLVKICQEKLDKATKQVNKIVNENNELEDFEVAERQENHDEVSEINNGSGCRFCKMVYGCCTGG